VYAEISRKQLDQEITAVRRFCDCEWCGGSLEGVPRRPEGLDSQPWMFETRKRPEKFVRQVTPVFSQRKMSVDGFIKTCYADAHNPDFNVEKDRSTWR
jgi:hypothetical protein